MTCQDNNSEITIERCPHDSENPYTMVLNELIRTTIISPACIALIIYLLSNKQGWKIKVKQIIDHYKPQMGRDKVYKLIHEAIDAGYIKQEIYLDKGKRRYKYYVTEKPKFKPDKCSPLLPEIQDTEIQDAEIPHSKERTCSKKEHIKENNNKQEEVVVVSLEEEKKRVAHCVNFFAQKASHENWGEKWRIPSEIFRKLISDYGYDHVVAQIQYVVGQHIQALKDELISNKKRKTPRIEKPVNTIKRACQENYADYEKPLET